jgi:hypothetical protein
MAARLGSATQMVAALQAARDLVAALPQERRVACRCRPAADTAVRALTIDQRPSIPGWTCSSAARFDARYSR